MTADAADSDGVTFKRAYYIKLGAAGRWAADSIEHGIVRFGWERIPLAEIHARDWEAIRHRLAEEHDHKGTVTVDTARLRDLTESTSDDVWITFHQSHLWWCRLAPGEVEEDGTSKFRRVLGSWRRTDTSGFPLLANQIPGRISQLQGFRGTVCSVREPEALARLLGGEKSPEFKQLEDARAALASVVRDTIRNLHWRDFETLVDLVFRQAGWRRVSVLGETMKYADLELEEPITGDRYQVQVKSRADVPHLEAYAADFSDKGFRKLYFVVHSPTPALQTHTVSQDRVELILPARLAGLVVDQGLVGWLQDKVR